MIQLNGDHIDFVKNEEDLQAVLKMVEETIQKGVHTKNEFKR